MERLRNIERARIETVFGLDGGALETEPWVATMAEDLRYVERLWYVGIPDYCTRAERDAWDWPQGRTVVSDGGVYATRGPAAWRVDAEGAWVLVAIYQHSGEAECPWGDGASDHAADRDDAGRCVLCECDAAEGHGYVYLGDGCYEAVYTLIEDSTFSREEWAEEHEAEGGQGQ